MKKKIIASLLAIVVIGWSTVVLSGCVEGQVSVERYIQALKDRDSDVREDAAEALGMIGDARAVEPLIQALKDDISSDVREEAAEALGMIGDARAVEPLTQALKDRDSDVREEAALALARIGTVPTSISTPIPSTLSPTPWVPVTSTPTPASAPASAPTPTSAPAPAPVPGFGVVFAIAGLFAVAYLLRRRK